MLWLIRSGLSRSRILEVELEKAETTSTSRSIRTTCTKSFALLRSSGSFLSARSRIAQWFIDFLFIARDSRKSNKLWGNHSQCEWFEIQWKQKNLTLWGFSYLLSFCLVVELDLAEMACVSRNIRRTLHVPSGVPVQRSISERSVSYPSLPPVSSGVYTYFLTLVGWWYVEICVPCLNFWRAFAFFHRRRVLSFDRRSDSHQLSNPNDSN